MKNGKNSFFSFRRCLLYYLNYILSVDDLILRGDDSLVKPYIEIRNYVNNDLSKKHIGVEKYFSEKTGKTNNYINIDFYDTDSKACNELKTFLKKYPDKIYKITCTIK